MLSLCSVRTLCADKQHRIHRSIGIGPDNKSAPKLTLVLLRTMRENQAHNETKKVTFTFARHARLAATHSGWKRTRCRPRSSSKSCNAIFCGDAIDPNSFPHHRVAGCEGHVSIKKTVLVRHLHNGTGFFAGSGFFFSPSVSFARSGSGFFSRVRFLNGGCGRAAAAVTHVCGKACARRLAVCACGVCW